MTNDEIEVSEAGSSLLLHTPQPNAITRINSIVMDGFKSFGRRVEIPFSGKFSVVLGPNGSGKSNISDAITFVLGRKSSKSMRAETSANLIYNGGKTKNPSKTAEVSIFFENKTRLFPVEEAEVKISRIVREDGQSKYRINGKTRTRQEVLELLSAAKIDPDGYNIIMQNDIISFVEMSPEERRLIVEDIAGIGIYEEKKMQALNELDKVEDGLNQASIVLRERENRLKELKADRDQALKYRELTEKLKTNKASHLKLQMNRKQQELDRFNEKAGKVRQQLDKLQSQVSQHRAEIATQREQIHLLDREIEQKSSESQKQLQRHVEQLKVDIAKGITRVEGIKSNLEKAKEKRQQLAKNIEELEAKAKELGEHSKELEHERNSAAKTIAELEKRIAEFKKKHKLEETGDIDQRVSELDVKADELQKSMQQLVEQKQNFLRENDRIEFRLKTIDESIEKVKLLEQENKKEVDQLKKKRRELQETLQELNKLLADDAKNAKEINGKRQLLLEAKDGLSRLEAKYSGMKDQAATSIAVRKILEKKEEFGKVYGTVAQLGSATEAKYALALDVAASSKLQSIVVEDEDTAVNAINYLKKNKLGIATFLPLTTIKPAGVRKEVESILKQKGIVGLAVELVKFDRKFSNVFSHVYGSTVVVDDIEIAKKIGIGRARIVTLDGDLAESSGAIHGGFRQKKSSAFAEAELISQIEKSSAEAERLEAELKKLEKARLEADVAIAELRNNKSLFEGDVIKLERSLHLDTSELDASKVVKEELQEKYRQISKQLSELDEKIDAETEVITKIKIERQQLREKIAELRAPRVLAELNAFEQKRRELSEQLIRQTAELENLNNQLSGFGRQKNDYDAMLKSLDEEKEQSAEQIKHLDAENRLKQMELRQKEKELEGFHEQFRSLIGKRQKLEAENQARDQKIIEIEEQSRKVEIELNTISIEQARSSTEFKALDAEFSQYQGVELDLEKSEEKLKEEIEEGEKLMLTMGSINLRALETFDAAENEYRVLVEKKDKLANEKDAVVQMMNEIEHNKKDLFLRTLKDVDDHFRRIFLQLSVKGDAYLELENSENPFEGGLRIKVKLTGDKFLDIRSLSGGEKTLTALAMIFALQEFEPAMFYVLDEVDAALDKHNSEKLAKLIRKYCDNAQYVVISHNDAVISEADTLFGVSMNPDLGISSVVSLKI